MRHNGPRVRRLAKRLAELWLGGGKRRGSRTRRRKRRRIHDWPVRRRLGALAAYRKLHRGANEDTALVIALAQTERFEGTLRRCRLFGSARLCLLLREHPHPCLAPPHRRLHFGGRCPLTCFLG